MIKIFKNYAPVVVIFSTLQRHFCFYSRDYALTLSQPCVLKEWNWPIVRGRPPVPRPTPTLSLCLIIRVRAQPSQSELIHDGARWYSRSCSLGLSQTHSILQSFSPIVRTSACNAALCCSGQIAYWCGQLLISHFPLHTLLATIRLVKGLFS